MSMELFAGSAPAMTELQTHKMTQFYMIRVIWFEVHGELTRE